MPGGIDLRREVVRRGKLIVSIFPSYRPTLLDGRASSARLAGRGIDGRHPPLMPVAQADRWGGKAVGMLLGGQLACGAGLGGRSTRRWRGAKFGSTQRERRLLTRLLRQVGQLRIRRWGGTRGN